MVGVGLMYIGSVAKTLKEKGKLKYIGYLPIASLIILFIETTVLIFFNGYINMRTQNYASIPLFWINVISAFIVGINISKRAEKVLKGMVIFRWLTGIGKNSIVYVVLNQIVIGIVNNFLKHISVDKFLEKIISVTLVFFMLYVCSIVFTRTKLKFLVGK